MKNILVLGGTGAMGKHIVDILSQRDFQLSVTTRSQRQYSANVEYLRGNAQDDIFLDSLLKKEWDAIIDFMVYKTPIFEKRVSKLLMSTKQYVFLSSARVYAESKQPLTESSTRLLDASRDLDFLSTDEYSLAKARQENLLIESGRRNWTIIRPYITYSESRLQLGVLEKEAWLYRALKGRTIIFSEDITQKLTTLTYGLDVSGFIAKIIGEEKAFGETYHITQDNVLSWKEVLNIYLNTLERHLGKRPRVKLLQLDDFLNCKVPKYQVRHDRLFNRVFNNAKITEFTNPKDFIDPREGLSKCLSEFLIEPTFQDINWEAEAIRDKYTNELTSLTEIKGWKKKFKYLIYRFKKV